jgi:hypothetical protein
MGTGSIGGSATSTRITSECASASYCKEQLTGGTIEVGWEAPSGDGEVGRASGERTNGEDGEAERAGDRGGEESGGEESGGEGLTPRGVGVSGRGVR